MALEQGAAAECPARLCAAIVARRRPLVDKTMLHSEQGLGDTLQFCRYARMVAALGAKVVLEVQPSLLPLLAGLSNDVEVLPKGSALPAFDCHCPLLSLPLAFGTELKLSRPARRTSAAIRRVRAPGRTRSAARPGRGSGSCEAVSVGSGRTTTAALRWRRCCPWCRTGPSG